MTIFFSKYAQIISCDGLEIYNPCFIPVYLETKQHSVFQALASMPYISSELKVSFGDQIMKYFDIYSPSWKYKFNLNYLVSFFQNFEDFLNHIKKIVVSNMVSGKLTILELCQEMNIHTEILNIFNNKTGINVSNTSGTIITLTDEISGGRTWSLYALRGYSLNQPYYNYQ